jgi:hypothetical protein
LQHVSARRQAQLGELRIFLAELAQRVTIATKVKGVDATQRATAAYIDFMEGWLSKLDESRIRAESLKQATPETPMPTSYSAGALGGAQPGGGGGQKAARTISDGATPAGGPKTPGAGGGGSTATPPATRSQGLGAICAFQKNFPCSPSIVGSSLGVAGAPPCKLCSGGQAHYHGECPLQWGRAGKPLPGFQTDGTRITAEWNKNEPIQKTVRAWVKFLSDASNFTVLNPTPAGVAGAPGLAEFKSRVALAPVKP